MTVLPAALAAILAGPFIQAEARLMRGDSASMLSAAKAAQEHFERVRRDHLPWTDGGWQDHCDEVKNFYCYTYGDPDDTWKPPKEEQDVTIARDSLVRLLGRIALEIPGDGWIAGQRVRYLVEAGKAEGARAAAGDCRSTGHWWCLALTGYAAHAAQDFAAAEVAFDHSLEAMDPRQRCDWRDIALLLPGSPSSFYRSLSCEDREGIERRFWRMADPLLLTRGNERRSEHFSRHVYLRMEDDAPAVSPRKVWLQASSDWVIRYGQPKGWERERSRSLGVDPDPSIVTHFPEPSQVFEPEWRTLDRPESLKGAWPLRPERARTGYVPPYAEVFDTLQSQVAVFRRGDSAVVLAAYDLSGDSVPVRTPVEAGLFLSPDDRDAPYATRGRQTARGYLTLVALPHAGLVSIEVRAAELRRAGRIRYWLPVAPVKPDSLAVSDILLLSRTDSLPRTLDDAAPLARASTNLPSGTALGLYWEVYGVGTGSVPLSISVTLIKEGKTWLKRTLGLGGKTRPAVSLSWDELSRPLGPTSGSIALDLARNDPGRYTLHLEVTSPGRGSTHTEREITITRPGR